jgi:hypothetical protein
MILRFVVVILSVNSLESQNVLNAWKMQLQHITPVPVPVKPLPLPAQPAANRLTLTRSALVSQLSPQFPVVAGTLNA